MHDPYACCEGTRSLFTRRDFLCTAGALSLAFLPAARADGPAPPARKRKTVLVPVFLRGGADGLSMLVPHGDAHYYKLRSTLAVPRASVLDLDGAHGLHPALGAWIPLWKEKQLATLHAVSHPGNNRSHFDEQDKWETGEIRHTIRSDGWLNRYLATHAAEGPIRAVAFGNVLPRILRGAVPVQAIRSLGELELATDPSHREKTRTALAEAYGAASPLLARTSRETLEALRVLRRLKPDQYKPAAGVRYPGTDLGRQFRQAAQMIKARIGLEVVELELGGWDTHQNQGGLQGAQANLMRNLALSTSAFLRDLGALAADVLVLSLSEFGRTAAENGTRGTDHGHGNCLFLAGGAVSGGKLHGRWPGLAPEKLNQRRDLAHTTDFRDVFREVLDRHLGCPETGKVLPGKPAQPIGLF